MSGTDCGRTPGSSSALIGTCMHACVCVCVCDCCGWCCVCMLVIVMDIFTCVYMRMFVYVGIRVYLFMACTETKRICVHTHIGAHTQAHMHIRTYEEQTCVYERLWVS
jgi:hypothetical protein